MVLVNGATGIGTGWSTDLPNYNPLQIIENLRLFLQKKKMKPMKPWYRGFSGAIESIGKGQYYSWGKFYETDNGYEITELPIRRWTQDYKEFLHSMLPGAEAKAKLSCQDVREYHTERKVHFSVKMAAEQVTKAKEAGVEHSFKLWSTINETNMVLFNHEGKIKKYKNVLEIMEEFATVRLKYYDHRKKYLIDKLTLERDLLSNRARFIAMIIAKKLHINNRKKDDVVKDLTRLKFQKFGETHPPRTGYEYLLGMHIVSLTKERKEELERMAKDKAAELEKCKRTSIQQMWTLDLDRLEHAITTMYEQENAEDDAKKEQGKSKGTKRKAPSAKPARGKGRKAPAPEEGGEEGGEEAAAAVDPLDNPFADIARWTSGALKAKLEASGPSAMKKRRTK